MQEINFNIQNDKARQQVARDLLEMVNDPNQISQHQLETVKRAIELITGETPTEIAESILAPEIYRFQQIAKRFAEDIYNQTATGHSFGFDSRTRIDVRTSIQMFFLEVGFPFLSFASLMRIEKLRAEKYPIFEAPYIGVYNRPGSTSQPFFQLSFSVSPKLFSYEQ